MTRIIIIIIIIIILTNLIVSCNFNIFIIFFI